MSLRERWRRMPGRWRWWLVPGAIAVGNVLLGVVQAIRGDYDVAVVQACLGLVIGLDRARERLQYRRGWDVGYIDALREARHRAIYGGLPTSALRWLVHGHPAREPWERDDDEKETNG